MTTSASPYTDQPEEKWQEITRSLLGAHPLKVDVIREVALAAWGKVWDTTVGSGAVAVRLADLRVPATVVGYFFEVLFARAMGLQFPEEWRGNESGDEKDLVHLKDSRFSVEIKTSGQLGDRVYGNRSYGQEAQKQQQVKKEKSGYYITVNFYERTLTLIRFGWIDAGDWKPQSSPTGQMAGLSDAVYAHKLIPLSGEYQLDAPVEFLDGVGAKTAAKFRDLGICTIRELLDYSGQLAESRLQTIRTAASNSYRPAIPSSPE